MQLTTKNKDVFINLWNENKPEGFIHPMSEGIATVILDYLDQAEYQLTLEDNKVTVFDQQTNEELGEYTPEKLFWKARFLIESNDKGSRSSTNHYNNLLDIFSNKELSPKEYKEQIRDELQNYYLTKECFNKNDELKWNSIDYTTTNWIEIENTYYEYEETRGFLSIGDSLTDLEEEYGENNFPEEAVEDGRLLIDEQSKLEEYIIKRHALKCFSDIEELLWDYEYQTKDVLKYYIPKIDNEQLEVLTDIVDSQNINLELLRKISFEDIYNEIDESDLSEFEKETLEEIKKQLSKPTVEIFKQSFDSFIMSLSEAVSKSIQKDIENLKAKALYVFNVDNNEYTIVSKRDGENPFMVHKYYPENETGGIHHGSYDIDTYENAEKIAANRLINEQKEKYELINFIAGTREEEFNLELKNELTSVFEYLNEYSLNEEDQIELIDVKAYQYEGPSGKLKVLVEYKGNCREDDLFNLLHDEEENGQDGHDYEINGYKLDLNPIKAEKSGTISEYLAMLQNVEEKWPEVNKLINEQKSQIETKYTKADINDLQSFFFSYPQLSESLCYQILDDFELYQIPLFKDSDGNIYQREMNTDLAEGGERDYQLLTQDGIIDQEYNWLIDRKYTPEDEIDLQKELEDIKKFEENPKLYYKNIFKIALEKEIEKVKKEINEGKVKDVIEKNILEIAEEKVGSHAVPEEIIGWYISDDEKNYFENWKNSGDFPYYKEALDSMFAYVYEHDTTKQNLLFNNIKKEPKYYEVEEARLFNGDIIFCPYIENTSTNLNRLLDKNFSTKEACEVFCRKENAFEIAKKYLNEIDESKEYDEFEKSNFVTTLFNQLKQGWNEHDNQPPSYKELEILIKGIDAFEYGEDSLSFIRPEANDIENGFDNGWDFSEICKGYAEFADGYNESNVICRLDDMMIFDSDSDAALQAKKDGYKFLEVGKDIIFPEEMLNADIEYRNYIDTPENRKILNEYLREDLKMEKKENFELKVGDRILISDDDLYAKYGRVHSEEQGYYELSCFEIEKISKQKDKVMLKRFSGGHIPQEAFEIEKLIKNKEELDEYLSTISTGKGFLLQNNGDIRANNQIRIIPITTVKEHEFNDSYIVSGTGDGTFGEFEINNLENQTLRKNPMLCNFDYRKDLKSASDFLANFTNIRDNLIIEQAPDVYSKEYELNDLTVNNETLTFGQFNSETNEIKLIKEAYFKELVIDKNDVSKNKVVLGFKENDQEQLLEMGETEYKNLLNAFGFSKEQQDNSLEINKYKTFAEEKPEVVFDMFKSDYLSGTTFSDNELIGYLKGLKKSNNYHHYLDELLFESLKQSDETLFSKVVDAGADITWRREENGESINVLHYAAADNLDIAIKKIIEKTKSLEVNDYINLFSEENFEGHTPLEIAISNSSGEYFETTKLLIDAMEDEGFSGVKDLLFEDKLGNKVLYTSKDNLGCVSILCFDEKNNLTDADSESLNDNKTLGKLITRDLTFSILYNFLSDSFELNRSSKLISELKEVPQKLWNDEINHRILLTIPNSFDPQQSFYDFDSILALEKIKKSLFVEFDNQKESLLQGFYTKVEFMDSFSEKELNFEDFKTCDLINFFKDDYWSPVHKSLKFEIADLCFDKKVHELFNSISPRPTDMGMCKNNDYTWLSLNINAACNNRPITEDEAEIILKYIQYEDYNFYTSVDGKLCMLDVSEDFTGEGEIMTPEKIVDMAHRMMVKACDLEYSIYDEKDEEVINDLQERFGLIEEQKIESSKDEELKKQETSVVEQFFSKLKDSLYDNAKLEDVLKSAATVLQTFSDTEKKEISQYLNDKGASSGDRVGKVLSSILEIKEPGQKRKRSKADDDTRGR